MAWGVGGLVLLALAAATASLFARQRPVVRPQPLAGASPAPVDVPASAPRPLVTEPARPATVRGLVRLPDGQPAVGASVFLLRARTAWPEWQREVVDEALTGTDGTFQFAAERRHDLLLECRQTGWAGSLEELPLVQRDVELRLQPGFGLAGVVANETGAPLGNVRVVAEPLGGDARRAAAAVSNPDGRYEFANLPAGPVRLVARHPAWQPAVAPAVVVGASQRVDLVFDRPSLPPLRGQVSSGIGQQPVASATVELLPAGARPGFAEPLSTTTDAEGRFALFGLSRGNAVVRVRHREYGAVQRTVAIGANASELGFELPARSTVVGRLEWDGAPAALQGLRLGLQDVGGELAECLVAEDGTFAFAESMSPGLAQLTLLGGPFAFQRAGAAALRIWIEERRETRWQLPVVQASRIVGRLVDDQGQPLPGVQVFATQKLADRGSGLGSAALAFDVGAFRSEVEQYVGFDRDQLLAVSGPDGAFEVLGRKAGTLQLRFELRGRGSRGLKLEVPAAGGVVRLPEVPMAAGSRLVGQVVRGERPVAGATVTVVGSEIQVQVVTAADGRFVVDHLPKDRYRLRARLPSMPTANAELEVAVAEAGSTVTTPLLVLPAGRMVRGLVQGSDGQPVPAALVTVRGAAGLPTVADGNGAFSLELPERNVVDLQVALADRSSRVGVSVRRNQDEVVVRLDTPPAATLMAQVFGLPGRKRLQGALVRVSRSAGGNELGRVVRWVDVRGGELVLPQCPVGRVRVQICCEGYAPWVGERELAANEEHRLGEILLEPACTLRGRVLGPDQQPIAGAVVLLGEEGDLDLFEPTTRSGPDGAFVLSGVSTRSATLVVRSAAFAPRTVALELPKDVLAETPLPVVLAAGATIEVQVGRTRARDGGVLQLRRQGRVLATAELDDSGHAEFQNRSPGVYSVHWAGDDGPGRQVRVAAGEARVRVAL
ncbi:MAG: carboxypeptidase regulatory-like domain-containing protein [Planctomycetes bacterium]|nr:carboxypeptidase regulatory-like domain-containing protein [Planctomycetota bacterium]